MKKKEKKMLLLLVVVAIIIIVALTKIAGKKNTSDKNNANSGNNGGSTSEVADVQAGEFEQILDDGSKMNTSNKLAETKKFGNYEVSNIQLTERDGQSLILADVKNVGESKADITLIDITLTDKDGNEITTIGGIIGDVEAGETVQLNASATTDFANAYDISFQVKADAE